LAPGQISDRTTNIYIMRRNVRRGAFIVLVSLVTIAFFGLIKDFLIAGFWAVVLAVIFYPLFEWLGRRLKGRDNLAAALSTLLILLLVVLPVSAIAAALINEVLHVYQQIDSGQLRLEEMLQSIERHLPAAEAYLARFGIGLGRLSEGLRNLVVSTSEFLANQALQYTQNAINVAIQFVIMLYLLYFFLRDGKQLVQSFIDALPLGNRVERQLLNRFASVARATLKGTLIVAAVQGTLGGLAFWSLDIPGAVFWGIVMTLFSILPVGSGFIWGPAAILLYLQGAIGKALILLAVGALLIGLIDNLLRPILVGRDTKMPDYLVLLSTLGGLTWFGLTGFVLGPVIAALFVSCWQIMGREYGGRDH